jgi:type IV secretory pathway VirB2 component (pilin)
MTSIVSPASPHRPAASLLAVAILIAVLASPAVAAETPKPPDPGSAWNALAGPLLQLLAVVIVVESALAALFQWRVYRMVFNGRAWKTPVMFGVGLLLVNVIGYDPMRAILQAATDLTTPPGGWAPLVTGVLSALMIAGGSSGINAALLRLGIRAPEQRDKTENLRTDEAYVSVRITGTPLDEPVHIGIELLASPDSDQSTAYTFDFAGKAPFAGSIDSLGFWPRLIAAFTADTRRFPNYGGRKLEAGKDYRIVATWVDRRKESDPRTITAGVFRGRFASRAYVDFVVDFSNVRA